MMKALVGPLVATATLIVLGFVSFGFYASAGGLIIATFLAITAGASASAAIDARHRDRNTGVVVVYVFVLLALYVIIIPSLSPSALPNGIQRGGANVTPPR